mgnify:CR=1 FL=1
MIKIIYLNISLYFLKIPFYIPNHFYFYTLDIYIDRKNRIWLLDFNVYSRATDALLFTWDKILNFNVVVDEKNHEQHEFRIVMDESQVKSSQLTMHKVPAEFVNNPKNFIEEFVDKYRNGEIE